MNEIFVVEGVSDSAPEFSRWEVATYEDEAVANRHCAFLNAFYKRVKAVDAARSSDALLEVYLRNYHPFDPCYQDNGKVEYRVVRREVLKTCPTDGFDIEAVVAQLVREMNIATCE